jgi:twinkle protein
VYDDGHQKCYSCGVVTFDNDIKTGTPKIEQPIKAIRPLPEVYHDLPDRKITAKTAKFFKVTAIQDPNSKAKYVYPRFDKDGRHVANKVRLNTPDKQFIWEGDPKAAVPFGQNFFPQGGKYITLVEGQDDAMAVSDMFGTRYPVWSADSAQEALQQAKSNFEYLNSFETIVINFDNDEAKLNEKTGEVRYPGQEAAVAVAGLFAIGKVKILTLADAKDANDYRLKGWDDRYVKAWWAAPVFTPTGLKLGKDMWDEVSAVKTYETVPYPFESMNKMTYGLRLSEVVLLTADTGVGKTSVVKEIEFSLLMSNKAVGFLHLEEPNADTAMGLMSIAANKPLHLPDVRAEVDDDELRKYYDSTINNDRVVIWDHFGSNTIQEVLNKIRHMHALGCKYIVLDHLSIVVSDQSGDERKQLDEISTKLKMLCMELNIAVLAVIHQNRQGQIRASAGPEQVANIVIKLFREKEDPDPWRRNVTKMVCQKNRFCGRTGPMSWLWYNEMTGRLEELSDDDAKRYEAGGVGAVEAEAW